MGFVQPHPGITGKFLTDVTVCTFDADTNSLRDADGAPKSIILALGSAGRSAVIWAVDDAETTCPRALLDHRTFEVLTRGAEQRDGSILFEEKTYRVIATALGSSMLCAAVPE